MFRLSKIIVLSFAGFVTLYGCEKKPCGTNIRISKIIESQTGSQKSFGYNSDGLLVKISGSSNNGRSETEIKYNANDQPVKISINGPSVTGGTYSDTLYLSWTEKKCTKLSYRRPTCKEDYILDDNGQIMSKTISCDNIMTYIHDYTWDGNTKLTVRQTEINSDRIFEYEYFFSSANSPYNAINVILVETLNLNVANFIEYQNIYLTYKHITDHSVTDSVSYSLTQQDYPTRADFYLSGYGLIGTSYFEYESY